MLPSGGRPGLTGFFLGRKERGNAWAMGWAGRGRECWAIGGGGSVYSAWEVDCGSEPAWVGAVAKDDVQFPIVSGVGVRPSMCGVAPEVSGTRVSCESCVKPVAVAMLFAVGLSVTSRKGKSLG